MALQCRTAVAGNGVVLVKPTEMVNTNHIIQMKAVPQTGTPPIETGTAVVVPAVEGVAPDLSGCREGIRGTSGYSRGRAVFVELKQLRMGPHICAVHSHVDGHIAYDLDVPAGGIVLQRPPVLKKLELEELLELHVIVHGAVVVVQAVVPAFPDVLRPLSPRLLEKATKCHKQGVIRQPPVVFCEKLTIVGILTDVAALIGQMQQSQTIVIKGLVIHILTVRTKACGIALLAGQHPFLHQLFQTDEIRVSSKGREGLIGGVPGFSKTRGTEG